LDGGQHGTDENIAADARRSTRFERDGFWVKRYWNRALNENFESVLEDILRALPK
jgi:very-short-patch-repair endonuclease